MIEPPTPPALQEPQQTSRDPGGRLRPAEKLILGFLVYVLVASAFFSIPTRTRLVAYGVNLLVASVIFLLRRFRPESGLLASLREALPCVFILVAYRESGLFVVPDLAHRLDYRFVRWDHLLLHHSWVQLALARGAPWLQYYLEISYLLCYPIVPLGLGALYLARRIGALSQSETERGVRRFWMAVLGALLFCYVVFPLFPLTPPRTLFHDVSGPSVPPLLRRLNLWILGHYGVEACIFPSGHVAGVTATALAVWVCWRRVGIFFLIVAVGGTAATVYGRYHYTADALAGLIVGSVAFFISVITHRRV